MPRPRRSVRGLRCARGSPRRPVDGGGAGRAATPWRVLGRGLRRHCGGARMLRHPFRRLRRSGSRVGARGGPDAADFFFGNFNECSHLLRRDTLVGWRLCGFALFPRTGAALGTTPGRGTLTDWRCLLSRTLLRMWLRAGLALGQHQGFFALRFSQPPGFLPVGFYASGFSPGRVFPGAGFFQRRVFAQSSGGSSRRVRWPRLPSLVSKDKAVVDKGAVSIRFRIVNELLPKSTMPPDGGPRSRTHEVPAAYGPPKR